MRTTCGTTGAHSLARSMPSALRKREIFSRMVEAIVGSGASLLSVVVWKNRLQGGLDGPCTRALARRLPEERFRRTWGAMRIGSNDRTWFCKTRSRGDETPIRAVWARKTAVKRHLFVGEGAAGPFPGDCGGGRGRRSGGFLKVRRALRPLGPGFLGPGLSCSRWVSGTNPLLRLSILFRLASPTATVPASSRSCTEPRNVMPKMPWSLTSAKLFLIMAASPPASC